jgi:UDPglucose--hexose-1-phosphate uridylyltransferase
MLPRVIEEVSADEAPGWRVRVVPNKFPAVRPEPQPADESHAALPGYGFHEVIIESPRHDQGLASLGASAVGAVVRTYRRRFSALAAEPAIKSVILFRNRGPSGGASLDHPHSQIIALSHVPARIACIAAWTRQRHAADGTCAVCRELNAEEADGRRVVEANRWFVVLVPFAAAGPCELRILPRRHQNSFAEIADGEIAEFGAVLQRSLARLDTALDNPSYRLAIESPAASRGEAPHFHWWVRLAPRVVTPGGFELGSGLPINPASPEDDAAMLRAALPGNASLTP